MDDFEKLLNARRYAEANALVIAQSDFEMRGPFRPCLTTKMPTGFTADYSPEAARGVRGLVFRSSAALDNHLRNKRYFFDRERQHPLIVTTGDSWCSFPFVGPTDLSESLAQHCSVLNLAVPGFDLGDMADEDALSELIWLSNRFKADAVFLSGGGNEMIGDEFPEVLSRFEAKPGVYLKLDKLADKIEVAIERLETVIETLLSKTNVAAIAFHSYDWPIPRDPSGWLGGPLSENDVPPEAWESTCAHIINAFDAALVRCAGLAGDRVRRVDLRGTGAGELSQWEDEIHLSSEAYAKAAKRVLSSLFPEEAVS